MPNGIFTLTQVNQAVRQGAWTGFIAPTWVEYLVVAGGGGGGYLAGGGGAGGFLTGVVTVLAGTSYTVTVGSGGAGGTGGNAGASGANAVFGAISATGGGAGGSYPSSVGVSGGSGGGANNPTTLGGLHGTFGQGIAGQGNAGGLSWAGSNFTGGGGGGAGTVGLNSVAADSKAAGNGGSGMASSITGTATTYAGGGGGAADTNGTGGSGGVGGGGAGGVSRGATGGSGTINGVSGGGNTGGGGGGYGVSGTGGAGGSGVVIIRYPGTVQYFTGGTLSYANGYVIHTFNASGTLAPTTPTPYVANDYQISRSLRFNSADSAWLSRTPASATNRRTWTWSAWVKLGRLNINQYGLFSARGSSSNVPATTMGLFNDNTFLLSDNGTGASFFTTQVFRDPSAWYHFVVVLDTTQATNTNRFKFYVNGVQVTAFSSVTYPAQNAEFAINSTLEHGVGQYANAGNYADGYMTEVNFIDGQALTPSSFGYYDFNTGVWAPTRYVGVYGTNGFYLNFSDNSNTTAATLGRDYSGNGNNWTPNNFSVTAGAGNDSLVDSPTPYGTDTGVGGSVRGNYCTLNPLIHRWLVNTATYSNGNLDTANTNGSNDYVFGTTSVNSGKFYWEVTVTALGSSAASFSVGVDSGASQFSTFPDLAAYAASGQRFVGGSSSSYGATYTTGDVIGVALDEDAGTVTFYKNNASQGAISLPTNVPMVAWCSPGINSGSATFNFGQRPFAYTAPSGFKALNTQNLPTPTIGATTATQAGKFFNPVTYTGNGGTLPVAVGFQPDFVWAKSRSAATSNILWDVNRGVGNYLASNLTDAAAAYPTGLQSFDANGFTLGSGTAVNDNNGSFVSWNWRANGTGVTNTAGSQTSTVSANTTSGFSVVTFTSQASSGNFTVGHGLGVAPSMVITKRRDGASQWWVWHIGLGNNTTSYLSLNTTNAVLNATNMWGSVGRTSSLLGYSDTSLATSATFVAYCFAEVPGYSRFGSYTGNGSSTDGPFVFCGFRPRYVLIKRTDVVEGWYLYDTARNTFNALDKFLEANSSAAEATFTFGDYLSNGFKIRNNATGMNGNGGTFIFAAFAEFPFKYSLAR